MLGKSSKIRDLKRELEEARDLSHMADQFAQAMFQKIMLVGGIVVWISFGMISLFKLPA